MSDARTGQAVSPWRAPASFDSEARSVGTHAFRLYEGELGVRIGLDQSAVTDDIDIASFERLSIALATASSNPLGDVFSQLKFEPMPSLEAGKVWRWRQTDRTTLDRVPDALVQRGRADPRSSRARRQRAEPPFPELPDCRAASRRHSSTGQASSCRFRAPNDMPSTSLSSPIGVEMVPMSSEARKDRAQAAFLIEVLSEERPDDLAEVYASALANGPAWRSRLSATLERMPRVAERLSRLG